MNDRLDRVKRAITNSEFWLRPTTILFSLLVAVVGDMAVDTITGANSGRSILQVVFETLAQLPSNWLAQLVLVVFAVLLMKELSRREVTKINERANEIVAVLNAQESAMREAIEGLQRNFATVNDGFRTLLRTLVDLRITEGHLTALRQLEPLIGSIAQQIDRMFARVQRYDKGSGTLWEGIESNLNVLGSQIEQLSPDIGLPVQFAQVPTPPPVERRMPGDHGPRSWWEFNPEENGEMMRHFQEQLDLRSNQWAALIRRAENDRTARTMAIEGIWRELGDYPAVN